MHIRVPILKFLLLFVLLCFGAGIILYSYTFGGTGDHRYDYMFAELRSLNSIVISHRLETGAAIPDLEAFNRRLDELWSQGPGEHSRLEEEGSEDALIYRILDESRRISSTWSSPPQVASRPDSIFNIAFFHRGPDGVSVTGGEDEDDLNSWDRNSIRYHNQTLHQREIRNFILSTLAVSAFLTLLIYMYWRNYQIVLMGGEL